MTKRLFDLDSHQKEFEATVLACEAEEDGYSILLSETAFFPEGGGQGADTGTLGGARVLDVQEAGGDIFHRTDAPLPVGEKVLGRLNWEQRFRRMQNHSGEHILSGLVCRKYGYRNVGFHLGDGDVTVDFDGELDRPALEELETEANRLIVSDLPVRAWYPEPEELASLDYRSKLALTENVRIVQIGDIDQCACCAPHVSTTGEIGSLRILDFMRHRGGIRLHMLCGLDALEDARARYYATQTISGLLSVPQLETPEAVRRTLRELEETTFALTDARRKLLAVKAASLPFTEGNLCLFEPELDMTSLRELVNAGMERAAGICAAFTGSEGDWRFIVGSRNHDMRILSGALRQALNARGGGKPEMIQGSCPASRAEIEEFFSALTLPLQNSGN